MSKITILKTYIWCKDFYHEEGTWQLKQIYPWGGGGRSSIEDDKAPNIKKMIVQEKGKGENFIKKSKGKQKENWRKVEKKKRGGWWEKRWPEK